MHVLDLPSQALQVLATGVKDTSLVPLSAEYLCIRAAAQPAVLVAMVAQSGAPLDRGYVLLCLRFVVPVLCCAALLWALG